MEEFLKINGVNIAIGVVIAFIIYFMIFNSERFSPWKCTSNSDCDLTRTCVSSICKKK